MYNSDSAASEYIRECGGNAQELPEEFVTVEPNDSDITHLKWKIDPMYKKDANGVNRVWQIGFDGISIWVIYGPVLCTTISTTDVKLTSSCDTLSQQAMVRCNSQYLYMYRDGYQFIGDRSERILKPMKGYDYDKCKKRVWPMLCDVKMDGIRITATMTNDGVNCLSYGRISYNHLSLIRDELVSLFAFLPDQTMTDGELYIHGVSFHEIVSIVRSNVNVHSRLGEIQYRIFDIYWPENPPADDRYRVLANSYNKYVTMTERLGVIRVVPKCYMWSDEEVREYMRVCVEKGYEGIVLRHSKINRREGSMDWQMTRYAFGRSTRMFKLKPYYNDEGLIVRVEDARGNEKDMCKLVLRLRNGEEMSIRYGSAEQKREWKLNPSLIVGQVLEFKYPRLHETTGIPQLAVGLHIRPYYV